MKLVLASNNEKKLCELRQLLADTGVELLLMRQAGCTFEIEETGTTFEENARIKAEAVCAATGLAAIGDDSGLCVDALGGAPGVYSARYTGRHDDPDEARTRLLLQNLAGVSDRTAQFVCCICCVLPDGTHLETRGVCRGEILQQPRGTGGFGYDPVFRVEGDSRSMAELTAQEKNAVSHRGRALKEFKTLWENYCHAHK